MAMVIFGRVAVLCYLRCCFSAPASLAVAFRIEKELSLKTFRIFLVFLLANDGAA